MRVTFLNRPPLILRPSIRGCLGTCSLGGSEPISLRKEQVNQASETNPQRTSPSDSALVKPQVYRRVPLPLNGAGRTNMVRGTWPVGFGPSRPAVARSSLLNVHGRSVRMDTHCLMVEMAAQLPMINMHTGNFRSYFWKLHYRFEKEEIRSIA